MSTPQNSVKPVVRTGSSPLLASGKTSAVQLSEEVSEWIEGMSPSGASVYDTGWVPLTLSSGGSQNLAIRRIGSAVFLRGEVWGVTAGSTLFTLAAQFRPTNRMAYFACRTGGGTAAISGDARVYIQTSGEFRMHNFNTMPPSSPGIDISQSWFVA